MIYAMISRNMCDTCVDGKNNERERENKRLFNQFSNTRAISGEIFGNFLIKDNSRRLLVPSA